MQMIISSGTHLMQGRVLEQMSLQALSAVNSFVSGCCILRQKSGEQLDADADEAHVLCRHASSSS